MCFQVWRLYIGATLVGLGQSIEGLTRSVAIQIKTPNHLMGKVFSISSTSNYAADTLSLGTYKFNYTFTKLK